MGQTIRDGVTTDVPIESAVAPTTGLPLAACAGVAPLLFARSLFGIALPVLGPESLWIGLGYLFLIFVLLWAGHSLSRWRRNLLLAEQDRAAAAASSAELGRALREADDRLFSVLQGIKGYAPIVINPEGLIVAWSDQAQGLYGYNASEAVGQPLEKFCSWDGDSERDRRSAVGRAIAEGAAAGRGRHFRKNGNSFSAHARVIRLGGPALPPDRLLVLVRDLNENIGMAEEARRSQVLFRNLTETARDAVITLSPLGEITSLNPAFEAITGWPRKSWVGRPLTALVEPADAPRLEEALKQIARGRSPRPVEVSLLSPGASKRNVELTATPQVLDGRVTGFLCIARDVTELRKTEERLRQAEKMEAVGRLAGGIAHDFNNLLTVINGYTDLLLEAPGPAESQAEMLREIKKAGDRAAALTRQLLTFSRKQVVQPKLLDLNALLSDLKGLLARLIHESIELETAPSPGPLPVKADPAQLEQVIINLAINAKDAMPRGGRLYIRTESVARALVEGRPNVPAGASAFALLSVADTGCGMSEEVKAHLFEPFFTTKELGKGTGLGLATVFGVVEQSGGFIEVQSEPGKGSVFKVYLPLSPVAAAVEEQADPRRGPALAGAGTVLLVEDEEGVRGLAKRALEASGYTVLEARNGREALSVFEHSGRPIDLLVTDVVMPLLGGVDLLQHLKRKCPDLKALLMSGYTDSIVVRNGAISSAAGFLQKPFTPEELTARVREALSTPTPISVV